ncbi:MAG: sulfotransferase domain-containing protein [Hyphomicrobiaceae bacterium]
MKRLYGLLRIPKSGSTTLVEMVRTALPAAQVYPLPHDQLSKWQTSRLQKLRYLRTRHKTLFYRYGAFSLSKALNHICLHARDGDILAGGHVGFETFRKVDADVRIITILREPLAVFLSQYNYARMNYENKRGLARLDSSFLERMAAKYSVEGFADALLERQDVMGDHAAPLLAIKNASDIEGRLAQDLFHFGLLEDIGGFAAELSVKLGCKVPLRSANVTGRKAARDLSSATRAKLEQLRPLDFEIYDVAVRLLKDRAREDRALPAHRPRMLRCT